MNDIETIRGPRWDAQALDLSAVDVARVRDNDEIFLLVCSASFVESGSDTYTRNLVDYFAGDEGVQAWLQHQWQPEELQHGRALKAYVQRVWPELDWDAAYADFFAEYSALCTVEALEPTRAQELAARCIVEMGTTTYYQALHDACDEPVLRDLTWRIRSDEVQHYKHFYHAFVRYQQAEALHRPGVLAALWRRVAELRASDADVALRHAAAWRWREGTQRPSDAQVHRRVYALMARSYPVDLAVRMALKPLRLPPAMQRWTERPMAALVRQAILH